jgi:hypothetical protein
MVMRTQVTFRLFGRDHLSASTVTDRLGISPSRSFEIGEPLTPGSSEIRSSSGWLLSSSDDIDEGDLGPRIEKLLSVLEPKSDALWDLVGEGYRASWYCFVASATTERATRVDRALLARLLFMPGDLLLDACGD